MAYEPSVLRRAVRHLEEQRERRTREQDRLRAEIYRSLPRLAEIDRQLRGTISQIIAASLRSGGDPAPAIQAVRSEEHTSELQSR